MGRRAENLRRELTQSCAALVAVFGRVELEQASSSLDPCAILHDEQLAPHRMQYLVFLFSGDNCANVQRSAATSMSKPRSHRSPSCSLNTGLSGSSSSASPTFLPLSSFSFNTSLVDTLAKGEAVAAE